MSVTVTKRVFPDVPVITQHDLEYLEQKVYLVRFSFPKAIIKVQSQASQLGRTDVWFGILYSALFSTSVA